MFLLAQVPVAGGHRQAGGFTHNGHPMNANAHIQVCHHLLDKNELLIVLLAEDSVGWPHNVEQLVHHRQHARKVRGPERAFKNSS